MNTIEQSLNLAQNYLNQQRFLYVFQYPLLISMNMCIIYIYMFTIHMFIDINRGYWNTQEKVKYDDII